MDRSDFMYRQKVNEAEMDEAFDDAETAMHNQAVDIGLVGVISGAVISENAPQAKTVLASASCRAYDQAGQRIYYAPQQVVDCEQDQDAVATWPASGYERTLMLTLAFDRLLDDLRTDGNGASVYYRRYETFKINVTAGAEIANPGPSVAPTPPSDELVLCDIPIDNTDTVITNAMLDITRRQDFEWTSADKIGVTAGSWTKIDSTVLNAQTALDSVDTELISRDGSGDIDQTLEADATTRDLGSSGKPWGELWHAGDIRHDGSDTPEIGDAVNPYTNGHFLSAKIYTQLVAHSGSPALGDATNRFDALINAMTVYTGIAASATGKYLGSTGAQFAAFLSALTMYGDITANTDGRDIGDAAARFDIFLNLINYYGALAGTFVFDSAESVTVMIPVSDFTSLGGTDWDWNATALNLEETAGSKIAHIRFNLPDGVTLTSMRIRWAQSATGDMAAQIESVDEDNVASSVGSSKTPTVYDASTNWDTIASGLTETVARATKYHRVKVTSGAGINKVHMLEATFGVTDILKAACLNCS